MLITVVITSPNESLDPAGHPVFRQSSVVVHTWAVQWCRRNAEGAKTKTKSIRKTAICIACFTRYYTQLCAALGQTQSHSAALIDDTKTMTSPPLQITARLGVAVRLLQNNLLACKTFAKNAKKWEFINFSFPPQTLSVPQQKQRCSNVATLALTSVTS